DGTGSGLVKQWARLVNVSGSYNYSWVDVTGKTTQWITNFSKKTLLVEGTWLLQMAATDVAGNNGTKVSTFTVDQTAPTATIDVPGTFTNQGNLTASWTGSGTGSPVDFYRVRLVSPLGASPGWSANIAASSAWITNFTIGKANLTEGDWTMFLFVQDMAGNNATVSKVFTVDLTKPLVNILSPVADGDGVATKDVNVTWDGSDALSGIDHYNVSIDGVWTVLGDIKYHVFINLSEGSHTVDVVAFDMAGNTQTATRTFIVDVTKPVVAITSPTMGQFFKVDTVNATWTMSDANLDRSEVSLDGAAYASVGMNNWSEMTALVDGTHTLSVIVYDIAGNWNETNVTFFVDKVSPVVVILNPVDGGYYNVTDINAAWLGVDPTPSSGIAYYETQLDAEGWVFMGATTVRPLVLTEGAHTFSVRAFDNATNNFTTSVSFVIDLTKPDVSVLFPSEGMMFASADVFMNWTATDNTNIASYEIMIDGGVWIPMSLDVQYTFTGLADGTHVASVKAYDLAGNFNVTSVSFVTDVTTPDVVITLPAEGSMFAFNSTFVEWTAVDNTTGLSHIWAWVDDDAPVNVTGLVNYTFTGLSEGWHVIHVQAWDLVGNSQVKTVNVLTDLSAPSVSITSPANLAHLASRTVTVNFDITDTLSGVKEIWIKLGSSADWTSIGTASSYTFTTATDTSGTPYTFLVKAQDNVGNEANGQVQFYVDTVAPSMSSHVPATSANGVLRNAQITVDFSEEMLASSVSVTLSPAVSGTYLWNSAHTQVIFTPSANMAFGTVYTATVAGTDLAGNALSGTNSWSFTSIGHVTGVVLDKDGNPIANANVNMSQGTGFFVNTTSDANGNFALDIPLGTYNLTISAPGQKDTVRNDVVVGSGTTVLGDVGMSPVDNWTWLIVAVIIIVAAVLILLYLRSKGKLGKKPEEPKKE
ncbi:MAG: Ig-like domain-containing protein, partial [Methanomassiliicoccales archaeon]|nr:Ig-like domain-containing protein [Methanomassiliicoccales archaeon]MDD1755205.1 Ig-like domain-containing protein [Methanomassiliicoccales archaeon]